MPAKNYDIVKERESVGHRLVESLAVGSHEDDLVVVPLRLQLRYACVDGLYLHDHPGLSSERIIIDLTVTTGSIIAEIVDFNLCKPLVLGPLQDGTPEKSFKHLRHYGKQIYSHDSVSFNIRVTQSLT